MRNSSRIFSTVCSSCRVQSRSASRKCILRLDTRLLEPPSFPKLRINGNGPMFDYDQRRYCNTISQDSFGEARNIDPTASKQLTVYYLDTLAMAKKLEAAGFTRDQSEVVVKALADVVNTALEQQSKALVTKPQQEIMVQQMLAQMSSLKKDMVILEKSEFTMIRNDTEKQRILIKQLGDKLNDEIKKLSGGVKLDINLEKSRAIEAHALNEQNLQNLKNKIDVEHANHEKNMNALDKKIDIEMSRLNTQIEKNKNDIMKYGIGVAVSMSGVYLAYLRLFS